MKFKPLFFLLALILLVSSHSLFSQETERDLMFDDVQRERYEKEKAFSRSGQRGGGLNTLSLPFYDDFSRMSLPTSDPEANPDWQRWSDDDARINNTFAIQPLTIGVATLDGTDGAGYPYDYSDQYAEGPADTLTSLPLDLFGFSATDNLYLVFHYQAGGLGNAPEGEDSLWVDFYSPFGEGQWFRKWAVGGGSGMNTFERVFIPINEPEFLLTGFRFRFRNRATISGSYDMWHIDYVQVDQAIDPQTYSYDEVAMQRPVRTLLNVYTAMPWTHYLANPGGLMADNFEWYQNNLGEDENIATGWRFASDLGIDNFPAQDFNLSANGFSSWSRTGNLNGYSYNTAISQTEATFAFSVYHNPTDAFPQNDTTTLIQEFSNYYAYDDGTAERAYAINGAGSEVALRYQTNIEDTLYGVQIYWIPYGNNPDASPFFLRLRTDEGGQPGAEIIENFTFHSPQYYQEGMYERFTYYPLDEPVAVNGTFYIGWVQSDDVLYNVGNDKNFDSNSGRLFTKEVNGGWTPTTITGSLMVRPVFKAGLPAPVNTAQTEQSSVKVYPNPAQDWVRVESEQMESLELFDIYGRLIKTELSLGSAHQVDISELSTGSYILRTRLKNGTSSFTKLLIR